MRALIVALSACGRLSGPWSVGVLPGLHDPWGVAQYAVVTRGPTVITRRSADERLDLGGAGGRVGSAEAEIDGERLLGRGGGSGHRDRRGVGHGRGGKAAGESGGEVTAGMMLRAQRGTRCTGISGFPLPLRSSGADAPTHPTASPEGTEGTRRLSVARTVSASSRPLKRASRARVADMRPTGTTGDEAARLPGARWPRDARAWSSRRAWRTPSPGG
jgi:hypothetical protein